MDGVKWLLFFYSVPARPVSSRMRLWRRLSKAGAVQLKGSVYILPDTEEHYELCQWLVSEVISKGGEGTFARVSAVETMDNSEIAETFRAQREKDYRSIGKGLEDIEQRISSIKKGTEAQGNKGLHEAFNKLLKEFEEIRKLDFFSSKAGDALSKRIKGISLEVKGISKTESKSRKTEILPKHIRDYQRRRWVTRKRPFVDRMASAWLIRKFIDKDAEFRFIDEKDMKGLDKRFVTFDMQGGEFTHIGDNCTFEHIVKAFGLKDRAVRKIAEIVHELDIKDDKFRHPETNGIGEILSGIRTSAKSDPDALEKGMAVFEMLYASKT